MPHRRFIALLALWSALLTLSPAALAADKVRVVASFSILADLVREVGGPRVELTALVGPDGDAHAYSPKPSDSARIAGANLVVINGLGFETWADRLVRAAKYGGARLVASKGIKALRSGGAVDPHAWQDVQNVKIYVTNIRDALSEADPAGREEYRTRADGYLARLDALEAEIRQAYAGIPEARRKVVTSHDAFTYYGDAYGIVFHSPQGLSTDSAPSAQGVARLIQQVRAEGITAVFVESMADRRLADQLGRETGAKVGGTLYSDALSSGAPAGTYIDMMRHNTRQIAQALR